MTLADAKQAKAAAGGTAAAFYQPMTEAESLMTDNIIDKSQFFRRRKKLTDDENLDRYRYLSSQTIDVLCEFLESRAYTPEQRVRIMTRIFDFVSVEIKIKKGLY